MGKNLQSLPSFMSMSRLRDSKRQELDIQIPPVLALAIVVTFVIYTLLLPLRNTALGILLYERGFTQLLTIALAVTVATIALLKFVKINREWVALNQNWISEYISLEAPHSQQVVNLQRSLANQPSLIARRCSRILNAYIESGDRAFATEFALDDSSFYVSATESSYSFPRILVWAIPLLGFIGTVIGISQAVNGFSGFLESAEDIDRIKEGIGTVTSGLAVAFDTTLLALLLSVIVMIPLVLVERFESRLLLAIDIYINDKLLPRLRESAEKKLDETNIDRAIERAIEEKFPPPEALIEPARTYAEKAAEAIAQGFVAEVGKVQEVHSLLIDKMNGVSDTMLRDRQDFINFFGQQQQASKKLIRDLQATLEEIKANNLAVANGLNEGAKQMSGQLEKAASALETRIAALEKYSAQVSEIAQLQQNLEQSFIYLQKTAQLDQTLQEVRDNLALLHPSLEQLNKPRRITLVERDSDNI